MVEVFDIIAAYSVNSTVTAMQTIMQVYASVPATMTDAESLRLTDCIAQLDHWMSKNRFKLNADKTQLIWLGTRQRLTKLTVT